MYKQENHEYQKVLHQSNFRQKNQLTGKSLSEALFLASTNSQYDNRLSIESRVQYIKIAMSEHVVYTNCFLFSLSEQFMYTTCTARSIEIVTRGRPPFLG